MSRSTSNKMGWSLATARADRSLRSVGVAARGRAHEALRGGAGGVVIGGLEGGEATVGIGAELRRRGRWRAHGRERSLPCAHTVEGGAGAQGAVRDAGGAGER